MKIIASTATEIYEFVRKAAQTGTAGPGDLLPPVRLLAEELGVNRNTVASAYQRLAKAGIVVTKGRYGTSICEQPQAGEQEGLSSITTLVDLADGNPDPAALIDIEQYVAGTWGKHYLYGDDTILPDLQNWGRNWFKDDCPAGFEVELTHGAVDALERLAAAHLVAGDKIVVEQPCFLGTINALRLAGMQAIGVPIDNEGMQIDVLETALINGARAVLITPRAHNPTGCSLTLERAQQISGVLARHPDVFVIIDDHFALLAESEYHSVIPDSTVRWALIRSVSKALGPDLRLAFLACDAFTAERLRTRLAPGMTWVSRILQTIASRCLANRETFKHLEKVKKRYAQRRIELRQALISHGIESVPSTDGFNVWIPLPRDAKDIGYELAKRGWLVRLGSAFTVQELPQAIRVTVSRLSKTQAEAFAKDLKSSMTTL
ncbi:Vitamin B6 salvage pathway transcriptional repressor PtsJ [compost metagenome]